MFEVSGAAAARVRPVSACGHLFIKAMADIATEWVAEDSVLLGCYIVSLGE